MTDAMKSYHTQCYRCKSHVWIDLQDCVAFIATVGRTVGTAMSVSRKRTRHGDTWGLLVKAVWLCPGCGKSNGYKEWTADSQLMLPGFGWQDFPS